MRVKRINKIKFPCLRQWVSIGGRHVVLFTDIKTGTVIDVSGSEYDLGYFSTNWYPCDSETEWKVFEGEITVLNNFGGEMMNDIWNREIFVKIEG